MTGRDVSDSNAQDLGDEVDAHLDVVLQVLNLATSHDRGDVRHVRLLHDVGQSDCGTSQSALHSDMMSATALTSRDAVDSELLRDLVESFGDLDLRLALFAAEH